MECLVCGDSSEVGALCRSCAKAVPVPDSLIPEHVRSTVATADAVAWLVDGFGQAHAVAARSTIGRGHDNEIVALSGSVSRGEHAELKRVDGKWVVRDMGSHNGVLVDGKRVQGRTAVGQRVVIRVGDVAMWFLTEIARQPVESEGLRTLDADGGMILYLLAPPGGPALRLVGNAQGGTLMKHDGPGGERKLAQVEYQLLRILSARAVAEASSPSATRGCVSTTQLANDLPFQSRYANEDNVRHAVLRCRNALSEMGVTGILSSHPGRGYFLACPVSIGR